MKKIFALFIALSPLSAFAQGAAGTKITSVEGLFQTFTRLSNSFIVILISAAVVYIIFNTIRYLIAGSEEDKKKGGYSIMYGIIALFVIISIWGLVYILKGTLQTDTNELKRGDVPKVLELTP